ncbi:MAG: hypothetical protein R6X35_11390 [Candidatus Krumholzibacteriia bacterium]
MKKLLFVTFALAAISLLAPSTGVAQTAEGPDGWYNHIGVYTTEAANAEDTAYTGAPGSNITAYVVITNPRNYNWGAPQSGVEQDIARIGGFEFKLIIPSNVFILSAVFPPMTINFSTLPNVLAGSDLTVTNGKATCLTLTLGEFSGAESLIYLNPHDAAGEGVPSVPGLLAITDYNDDFRLVGAYPSSGSFDNPVFGLWPTNIPTPTEDASWGELKSLYR